MSSAAISNLNVTPMEGEQPVVKNKPLGERLLEAGHITSTELEMALREQKRHSGRIGKVLVDLGFVTENIITKVLAVETKTEVVDLLSTVIDEDVLALVDYESAKRFRLIPISRKDSVLTVALADAFNVVAIDTIEKETGLTLEVVSALESDILEALERHFSQGRTINDTVDLILSDIEATEKGEPDSQAESPMVRLVDQVIAQSIKNHATDIHIEPDENFLRIRQRIDGVLGSEVLLPKTLQAALIARIKLMADLNVTEKRVPQDGRIRFQYGQTVIDLRLSTLPTNHGESLVMRILDSSGVRVGLDDLGFDDRDREIFSAQMQRSSGLVLVTGPTGSGKTTTLYTALGQVDANVRSVFTLEDPIEYSLPLIRQTQVNADVGMSFAAGLRALLRQDPDVILIGEIRDLETAQLAARAALTGHLVLSTLHTNNSAGVIPRLVDMGIDRYMLPSALSSIVGQRLVRKICKHCKTEIKDTEEMLTRFHMVDDVEKNITLFEGEGCSACNQTGYQGRMAIYEVMVVDEQFHELIIGGATAAELQAIARKAGMKTMQEDGIQKAINGETSLSEIMRVVG